MALLASVEQGIVECFRKGGGLPYTAYSRFHRLMAEGTGQALDTTSLDRTLPAIAGLVDRLDEGIDGRQQTVTAISWPNIGLQPTAGG